MTEAASLRARAPLEGLSASDRLAIAWLVGLALLAAARHPAPVPLIMVAATTIAVVLAVAAWATHSPAGRVVHDFLPIALIPVVFNLAGPVIAAANPARWDSVLAGIDARFCASLVSAWRNALGRPTWLTDAAYLSYVSFYFVPLAMAVALYRGGRRGDFDSFVFAVMIAFFLPYVGYLLLPATGPRVPAGSETQVLGGSAIADSIRAVLRVAEVNKLDAFPSGHAAVSLVFLVLGARLFPAWRVPLVAWIEAGRRLVTSTQFSSLGANISTNAIACPPAARALLGSVAMNQQEWSEPTVCCDCGASIWPELARAFACSPEAYLCFECAERRGGVFDATEERWIVAPNVADLPDERRPHP